MLNHINIGGRRELLWDEYLLDKSRTSTKLRVHQPRMEDIVLVNDAPWEGDGCDSHSIIKDGDKYRMYYLGWEMLDSSVRKHTISKTKVCYAESGDGIHWEKPSLGLCDFEGSSDNNIVLDQKNCELRDMVYVFLDNNPDCPDDQRYKAIGRDLDKALSCYISADGLRFRKGWRMSAQGAFDTQNIAIWVPELKAYMAFVRDFHDSPCIYGTSGGWNDKVRDIRWMSSPDFKSWTTPQLLDFQSAEDYPLYVNAVQQYYRAPHQLVGFPSRYVERREWTSNFDQLAGAELRRKIIDVHPRYGLTTTDCVFMTSRDGKQWHRFDEAFISPGIERRNNWVYGDCFLAPAMIETPSRLKHAPNELSLLCFENHWRMIPAELRRYTIRIDGFASCSAGYAQERMVTRPFVFNGGALSLNFSTSARGYLNVTLRGPNTVLKSCELFGDTLSRIVSFDGRLAALSGKEVIMEIEMSDADLFSFQFIEL
jgi:hypothetical protein